MSHCLQLKKSRKLNFPSLRASVRYCSSLTLFRNQRGVALLYLIIFFTLLGVLVSAGVRMFGSTVNLTKVTDTKTELERDVRVITAWAVKNGRLPTFEEYSTTVFGTKPKDAWGKSVLFTYYSSLTKTTRSESVV